MQCIVIHSLSVPALGEKSLISTLKLEVGPEDGRKSDTEDRDIGIVLLRFNGPGL